MHTHRAPEFEASTTLECVTRPSEASSTLSAPPSFARRALAIGLSALLVSMTTGDLVAQQAPQQYAASDQYDGSQDPGQMPDDPAAQNLAPADPAYANGSAPQYSNAQYGDSQYGAQQQYGAPAGSQALSNDQLNQLVAPIALYPDSLVAQILAAATYPTQVVQAARWRQSLGNQPADQIAADANQQSWDPSVKALVAFPSVLAQMDRNLQWTTDLGNAYYNAPQDVMNAIQEMRTRAQQAGNLSSNQQQVVSEEQGNIEIAPANPEVVYVPSYNPWYAYGAPLSVYPDYYYAPGPGVYFGEGLAIGFGLGVFVGAFTNWGWGWGRWGTNWGGGCLWYNHNNWYTHSSTVYNHGWGRPGGPSPRYAGYRGSFLGGHGNRDFGSINHGGGFNNGSRGGSGNGFNRGGYIGGLGDRNGVHINNGAGNNGAGNRPGFSNGRMIGGMGDRGGINRPSINNGGINRPGINNGGFNRPGINNGAINRPGTGFNGGAINRPNIARPGVGTNGVNRGFNGGFNGGVSGRPGGSSYAYSRPNLPGGSFYNPGNAPGRSTYNAPRAVGSYPGRTFATPGGSSYSRGFSGSPAPRSGYSGYSAPRSFSGGGYSTPRSGGYSAPRSFGGGGFSAPRSGGFSAPRSFGGGHSSAPHFSGGGGGGHMSAPHFSGGGGGGGHFGGGSHGGGGGGSHGGGGHHR